MKNITINGKVYSVPDDAEIIIIKPLSNKPITPVVLAPKVTTVDEIG